MDLAWSSLTAKNPPCVCVHVQMHIVKYLVKEPKWDFGIFEVNGSGIFCNVTLSSFCSLKSNELGILTISYENILCLSVLSIPATYRVDLVQERESILTQS